VQNLCFAGCSLRQLPGRVSIPSQEGHYFCPEEISIPSRRDQYSFPSRSAFSYGARVPVASTAFARKKFLFAGAFAVVVTPVPVEDTTGFSGAFPRRSAFLPEQISISDERGYSPRCVEKLFVKSLEGSRRCVLVELKAAKWALVGPVLTICGGQEGGLSEFSDSLSRHFRE
jgi:hypothetical protein